MSQAKILLIDDEPSIRKLVSAYLKPEVTRFTPRQTVRKA